MASSNQTTLCLVLTEQLTKPLLCNLNTTYLLTLLPENLKRSIIIINSSGTIYYAAQFFAKKLHQIHRTFVAVAMSCMYVPTCISKTLLRHRQGCILYCILRNRRKMRFFTRSLLGSWDKSERERKWCRCVLLYVGTRNSN